MGFLVTVLQSLSRYVRVNLGGGKVLVPEQLLYAADVGASVEKMGGKRMPNRVRSRSGIEPGLKQPLFENSADAAAP